MMSTAFDLTSISAIFERLFAVRRLADEQAFEIDADALGPGGVEGVLGVDERGHAAVRWALAMACRATVVLPLASGPKISMMRPRGNPLPPRAMSRLREPVVMPCTSAALSLPSCMMAPLPNCFSICCRAFFNSRSYSTAMAWSSLAGKKDGRLIQSLSVRMFIYSWYVFVKIACELF